MSTDEQNKEDKNPSDDTGFINHLEDRVSSLMHDIPESVHEVFRRHRRSAFEKHPFLFSTLGLLGLVATWQGFADVIEKITFFDMYPGSLLTIGLVILLLTGRLYREIDNKK